MDGQIGDVKMSRIVVPLNAEELAAVEGWRRANELDSQETAIRQLVRLGLLNEISRIYQSVTSNDESS
ncbi:MAG: hypothetical protein AAFN27_10620 [Pseudomonadota bacterium]